MHQLYLNKVSEKGKMQIERRYFYKIHPKEPYPDMQRPTNQKMKDM